MGTHQGWQYTLLAEDGAALARGEIADPRVVRSTLSMPGATFQGHTAALLDSGDYLIPVPAGLAPRKLRIAAKAGALDKLGKAGVPADDIEIALDPG
jgi:hypothetical protein